MLRYVNQFRQKGWVLLSTLILLNSITLIVMSLLQSGLLSQKITEGYQRHQQLWLFSERMLRQIEQQTAQYSCQVSLMTRLDLGKKSFSWWHKHGCYGRENGFHYRYIAEPLDNGVCIGQDQTPASYWRVTLLTWTNDYRRRERLQSVIITPDNASHHCVSYRAHGHFGRQSWRRLLEMH